ncbi:ElyC/SanA/YdcF family protein [Actinomycetaceae bacterium MB13-C1-2]|nr:ElyC/SanA/YdcF family protein [Actinomycetaceae bacterium MB13-C1-2]
MSAETESQAGQVRSRPRRWLLVLVAMLVTVVTAGTVLMTFAVWNPNVDRPEHADAIVVLAYSRGRLDEGRNLAEEGVSDNLVISHSVRMDRMIREGELPVVSPEELKLHGPPSGPWVEECGAQYPDYFAICITPEPNTTVGEALGVDELSAEMGWDDIVVVTERSHLARAEHVFKSCTTGNILPVSSGNPGPFTRDVYRTVYELAGWIKDRVVNPCR